MSSLLTLICCGAQQLLACTAQRQKAIAAQKPTAAQPKKVKPVAMDIDHREGKRKRQEGRTAPSKKTRTSDAAPARKAKAAASQVTVQSAHEADLKFMSEVAFYLGLDR